MATPKVTIGKRLVHDKVCWVVSRREGGKRRRTFFKSKTDAEAEAERLRDEIRKAGEAWFSLPAADRERLMLAYHEAQKKGLDLQALLSASPKQTGDGPPLGEVITELVGVKERANRSSDYTTNLKHVLEDFSRGIQQMPIGRVTVGDVETFLDRKNLRSRSTLRSRLSTLFKFAIRRGYCIANPCAQLEPITITKAPPAIFTVKQFQACLKWLRKAPRGLAWFVLSTCCGLRPEEAEKTTRADLHFKEGWIKIEAQTTKVRQRRVVYPKAEAMQLLKKALERGGELPLDSQPRRRVVRRLRKLLGLPKWPKDITRHTAASYWLADSPSAERIADSLGNSEKILKRDYRALVTQAQAKEFWKAVAKAAR